MNCIFKPEGDSPVNGADKRQAEEIDSENRFREWDVINGSRGRRRE